MNGVAFQCLVKNAPGTTLAVHAPRNRAGRFVTSQSKTKERAPSSTPARVGRRQTAEMGSSAVPLATI